jgi:hypothetical protein
MSHHIIILFSFLHFMPYYYSPSLLIYNLLRFLHHSTSIFITPLSLLPSPFSHHPLTSSSPFSPLTGGANNQPAIASTEPLQILRANIRNNRLEYDGRVSINVKVKNFVPGLRGAQV